MEGVGVKQPWGGLEAGVRSHLPRVGQGRGGVLEGWGDQSYGCKMRWYHGRVEAGVSGGWGFGWRGWGRLAVGHAPGG
eukprot:749049-Hanusia_phi.AAC.5